MHILSRAAHQSDGFSASLLGISSGSLSNQPSGFSAFSSGIISGSSSSLHTKKQANSDSTLHLAMRAYILTKIQQHSKQPLIEQSQDNKLSY